MLKCKYRTSTNRCLKIVQDFNKYRNFFCGAESIDQCLMKDYQKKLDDIKIKLKRCKCGEYK